MMKTIARAWDRSFRLRLTAGALWVAFLASMFLWAPIAQAGSSGTQSLQASGTYTTSGNSAGQSVKGLTSLLVFFKCSVSSGTGETLDLFLQSSDDGGTTWYDLPFELAVASDGDGTETAPTTNKRDFVDLAADAACVNTVAIYRVFGDYIRVRWFIAGTTPSYAFAVNYTGKG